MPSNSAEYMRSYRARRKEAATDDESIAYTSTVEAHVAQERIAELEAEVLHLKAELAKRPTAGKYDPAALKTLYAEERFNTRPFTPVPKR